MSEKYLSDFQIVGTSIKSLKIKNDFVALEDRNKVKRKIDISHCLGAIEKNEEDAFLSGTIVLNIKVAISEGKKKYNLDLAIEGCFIAPIEIKEEVFVGMLQVNGITSLYSIARGFIQSISAQSLAAGSVLLPMINVVSYSKNANEANRPEKS